MIFTKHGEPGASIRCRQCLDPTVAAQKLRSLSVLIRRVTGHVPRLLAGRINREKSTAYSRRVTGCSEKIPLHDYRVYQACGLLSNRGQRRAVRSGRIPTTCAFVFWKLGTIRAQLRLTPSEQLPPSCERNADHRLRGAGEAGEHYGVAVSVCGSGVQYRPVRQALNPRPRNLKHRAMRPQQGSIGPQPAGACWRAPARICAGVSALVS